MKLKTKTTNPNYKKLIMTLWKSKRRAWREVVKWLNRPKRRRVSVNLNQINRNTKENDLVVVPGKVLGLGEINHKLQSIAAYSFQNLLRKKLWIRILN